MCVSVCLCVSLCVYMCVSVRCIMCVPVHVYAVIACVRMKVNLKRLLGTGVCQFGYDGW